MATTLAAARCAELIARYRNNSKSKEPNFTTQWNSVWLLLGRLKLSRHNVILAGKFITEMQDFWTSRDQMEMLDQLRERQARSWKRWEKRIAEKQAAKAAGATKGRGKKEPVLAQPTPGSSLDPWSLI